MKSLFSTAFIAVMTLFASVSHSEIFQLEATYTDGTEFSLTYEDNEGDFTDGSCISFSSGSGSMGCTILAGSITLGTTLDDVLSPPGIFNVNLSNLLANPFYAIQIVNPGGTPSFGLRLGALSPEIEPFKAEDSISLYSDAIGNISSDAFANNYYCTATDVNGCTAIGFQSPALNSGLQSVSLTTVPLPAGVWLFGSALAGLIGLRTKRK